MINIQILIFSKSKTALEKDYGVNFFNALQSRTHMIEFMKSNSTFSDFHEIYDIFKRMKTKITENIEASNWLHGDELSDLIREKIKERVASIQMYHDFDELDKNATMILKINRDINDFYFSTQRKTGSVGLDTVVGLRHAFVGIRSKYQNTTEGAFITRIYNNFRLNAFYEDSPKTVTMLAPYMYREAFRSDILKEPFITYSTLGHELYHSLFSPSSPPLNAIYSHREECVEQHFERSCEKFAMGACASGRQTFNEDMPDLESYRLLHRILREEYNDRELSSKIEGFQTTLEQAFFYYVASEWCTTDVDRSEAIAANDPHSAGNVRLNAALSLMPEFMNAFGCKEGQPMFVDKEHSCFVFGPNS